MIQKFALFTVGLLAFLGVSNLVNNRALQAMETIDHPVVVELYTSQSCSSCPPADRVLGELVKNDNVIGLTCNVTYWNYLHWEDTLSKNFCDTRQRQYVRTLKSRGPYTPQVFINGDFTTVGSKARTIQSAIENTHKIKPVGVSLDGQNVKIDLPKLPEGKHSILLIPYGKDLTQSIPSGENRGRTVHYTNPIIDIIDLGKWDGQARDFTHDLSKIDYMKGVAVFIHKNHDVGKIVAAGKAE